jgi:dihydroorotase
MRISLLRPDDWHLHLRDGAALSAVLAHTAERFGRAIVMPNLKPAITTTDLAGQYRARILAALPAQAQFTPLMTLYLTDNTPTEEVRRATQSGFVHAIKYYPAGATTHADAGVTALHKTFAVLATMEELGLPLLVHGEVTDRTVDIFDREAVFIDRVLSDVVRRFPALRVVFEHITTQQAVDFVKSQPANMAATITPQHLLLDRNALFDGGIRPHHYCLPVLKRAQHREALIEAATSGNPKFFLGTDSAPHAQQTKENACGCAGIYSSHAGIELYAEVFEQAGHLDRLEAFASHHGADFYRLPRHTDRITLSKEPWSVPASYAFGHDQLIPFRAGNTVAWQLSSP